MGNQEDWGGVTRVIAKLWLMNKIAGLLFRINPRFLEQSFPKTCGYEC